MSPWNTIFGTKCVVRGEDEHILGPERTSEASISGTNMCEDDYNIVVV